MLKWPKRSRSEPQAPVERWHTKQQTEHFVHLELHSDEVSMQVLEELRTMNLRVITCDSVAWRNYQFDFLCERFDYGA